MLPATLWGAASAENPTNERHAWSSDYAPPLGMPAQHNPGLWFVCHWPGPTPNYYQTTDMDSPANTKRRRTESDDPPRRRVISDEEEAEELEEYDNESDSDDGDGHGDLASRDTVLISEIRPEEYAGAVSRLQALGVAMVQDDLPYSTPMATMALNIPAHEVEETALLLSSKWVLPGRVTIGRFIPAGDQIKLAVRAANKDDVAMVTSEALAEYARRRGIEFDHGLVAVTMVAPGTWAITLEDAELATRLTSLYKVVLFGKELSICVWKESFRQSGHHAYVSGLAETTSRRGVVEFFHRKCGDVINHHFGKLPDSRPAPWITIQFRRAGDLTKALEFNNRKRFNGKYVSVTKAKTEEEREADLKRLAGSEVKLAARAAAQQARQQRQAERRATNAAAMAEYERNALLLAQGFPKRL